jgi:hypothetical protein
MGPQPLDLAHARGAGDVDLAEAAIDHIDADKEQARLAQGWTDLGADPPLRLAQLGGLGAPPTARLLRKSPSLGTRFTAPRASPSTSRMRLSPALTRGQEGLHHHRQLLLVGDQFQQSPQARGAGAAAHHPLAGPAPQGLEHHLRVVGSEGGQLVGAAAH